MARSDRTDRIAASVARGLDVPDLVDRLSGLSGSALGSLLLAVLRARAEGAVAPAVRSAFAAHPLHHPSAVEARRFHHADGVALAAAAGFEALDLSPAAPLGACTSLAGTDPNNVLIALRGAEVLGDPTIPFALEAARRRTDPATRGAPVRLCASARLVRLQPVQPPLTPHFRVFALGTAGRDAGGHDFELAALEEHAGVWLRFAAGLRGVGYRIGSAAIVLSDLEAVAALLRAQGLDPAEVRAVAAAHRIGAGDVLRVARGVHLPSDVADPRRELGALHAALPAEAALRLDRVLERSVPALRAAFPGVAVRVDLSRLEGLGYYPGLALRVVLDGPAGPLPVGDGGFTAWTQALLADRKERFLASAMGTELLCKVYATDG